MGLTQFWRPAGDGGDGWHYGDDHRGPRLVFLNGQRVDRVILANESKGVVIVCGEKPLVDKKTGGLLAQVFHGDVVVKFLGG